MGTKALAIDRAIEDAGRRQPVPSQRAEEGKRAPMAVRSKRPKTLAFRPPASDGRHVCFNPCLVDKDETFRIKMMLQGLPSLSPAGDVGAGLFKGEQRFF